METPRDPAASRYEHAAQGLRRSDLDPDPIKQFANWFTAAIEAGIRDVNAMSLATADSHGKPSVRIVLLKGFDQDGFVFFTNYESEKGKQLDANPYAALAFYWIELDRQIRISGKAEKTSREESQAYFHTPGFGSANGEDDRTFRQRARSIAAALGRLPNETRYDRILAGTAKSFARSIPLHATSRWELVDRTLSAVGRTPAGKIDIVAGSPWRRWYKFRYCSLREILG
jgi:hypothetical protein